MYRSIAIILLFSIISTNVQAAQYDHDSIKYGLMTGEVLGYIEGFKVFAQYFGSVPGAEPIVDRYNQMASQMNTLISKHNQIMQKLFPNNYTDIQIKPFDLINTQNSGQINNSQGNNTQPNKNLDISVGPA